MRGKTIALIGAGNMGRSLIEGWIAHGHAAQQIWASDLDQEKLHALTKEFHIHTTEDNKTAIEQAEVVIFAIKPQYFAKVAKPLASIIKTKKPLIISIAAGIRAASIANWLDDSELHIVRTMPNLPALMQLGASALFANAFVTEEERALAQAILQAVGLAIWIEDESLMDAVTALSGSGPAYFFLILEALEKAGIELGLAPNTAHELTLQTALGAINMALSSKKSLAELRKNVTSPGGTTEKAISVLEEGKIRDLFKQTLLAAQSRSLELAALFED